MSNKGSTKIEDENEISYDTNEINGIISGYIIGDAMGMPYDTMSKIKVADDRDIVNINDQAHIRPLNSKRKYMAIGQISYATEMSVALHNALVQEGKWDKNIVIQSYIDWANTNKYIKYLDSFELFKAIKSIVGYSKRYNKSFISSMDKEHTRSNICIMRMPILGAYCIKNDVKLSTALEWAEKDVHVTNPNSFCSDLCMAYINAMYSIYYADEENKLLAGLYVLENVRQRIEQEDNYQVQFSFIDAENLNLNHDKDNVANTYWCSIIALSMYTKGEKIKDIFTYIIRLGGTPNINCAVAGALLGMCVGDDVITTKLKKAYNVVIGSEYDDENSDFVPGEDYRLESLY